MKGDQEPSEWSQSEKRKKQTKNKKRTNNNHNNCITIITTPDSKATITITSTVPFLNLVTFDDSFQSMELPQNVTPINGGSIFFLTTPLGYQPSHNNHHNHHPTQFRLPTGKGTTVNEKKEEKKK